MKYLPLLLFPLAVWSTAYTIELEPGNRQLIKASELEHEPIPEKELEPAPVPEPESEPEPEGLLSGVDNFEFAGEVTFKRYWLNGKQGSWSNGGNKATFRYSMGAIAFRDDRGYPTMFAIGHDWHEYIGEFRLPTNLDPDVPVEMGEPVQPGFVEWPGKPGGDVKYHGLLYRDGKLAINGLIRYDASHSGLRMLTVLTNPDDLANSPALSNIDTPGPKSTGQVWISPIPPEHQERLKGDVMFGGSNIHSIVSRHSLGPSAIAARWEDIIKGDAPPYTVHQNYLYPNLIGLPKEPGIGEINGRFVSYIERKTAEAEGREPVARINRGYRMMFGGTHPTPGSWQEEVLGPWPWPGVDPLVTQRSTMPYCLVVPGTFTYACFGSSFAKVQGVGYKNEAKEGIYPTRHPNSNGYSQWIGSDDGHRSIELFLFDIRKWGTKEPHEYMPYYTGYIDVPEQYRERRIGGGTFDAKNKIIYLGTWGKNSTILALKITQKE